MKDISIAEQENKIRNMLMKIGLPAQQDAVSALQRYYVLLTEWNRVMNLTAITEFEDVVEKHFADSLLITAVMDLNHVHSMMDVGTGAGFPGIVLKILFPEMEVTLLDSLKKRVGFLNEVILQLELDGIRTLHGRAEDYGRDPHERERYDLCVSRAVANLSVLSEFCIPFVRQGGMFVSYKSMQADQEISDAKGAIDILGGTVCEIKKAVLPFSGQERMLVCIEKQKNTPDQYPRRAGIPTRRPL